MLDINDKILCSSCFAQQTTSSDICDGCGFDNSAAQENTGVLPMGMLLLDKYVIGKVLGRGGFGITYLAFDAAGDKKVAIKEYFPDSLSYRVPGTATISSYTGEKKAFYDTGSEKFYSEAKMLSRFNGNDNIINVTEFFYENNTAYYVMEYVDGVDLKQYIAQHGGRLQFDEVMRIITPVLYALIIVHSMDVLHRDISPDNIYITKSGDVKLLDFGAARQVVGEQSNSLSVILKQGFTPIEQYKKRGNHGPWSDIYSLGATIYYALTGAPPEESINRTERDDLRMPSLLGASVPPAFEQILRKMLAVKPESRWQSVLELKEALQSMAAGGAKGVKLFTVKNKPLAAVAGGGILLAIILLVAVMVATAATTVSGKPYTMKTSAFTVETEYSGEWRGGAPNGEGELTLRANTGTLSKGDVFRGEFVKGLLEGEGEYEGEDGAFYAGEFKNGLFDGFGTIYYANGNQYTGTFSEGAENGQGTLTCANGDVYTGSVKDGKASGEGKCDYADGGVYEGQFSEHMPNGQGTYTAPAGAYTYTGGFRDSKFDGQGTVKDNQSGITFTGSYREGKRDGPGVERDASGNVVIEGIWKAGEYAGASEQLGGAGADGQPLPEQPSPSGQPTPPDQPPPSEQLGQQPPPSGQPSEGGQQQPPSGQQPPPTDQPKPSEQQPATQPQGGSYVTDKAYVFKTSLFSVNVSYTGEWANNAPNGDGEMHVMEDAVFCSLAWSKGSVLTGSFKNGLIEGTGYYDESDDTYMVAEFIGGIPNGEATIASSGYYYIGDLSNAWFSGQGTLTAPDGSQYIGSFKSGAFNGQGRFTYPNGAYYEGEFKDGMLYNGYGYGYNAYGVFTLIEQWVNGELSAN
jgi:serine/threonine protein kinase